MIENWTDRVRRACRAIARDQGGNVLMIAAAAIVPLLGIIGSGIDIGRAYMTQLRLQQACDAGVLAGRRSMGNAVYGAAAKAEATKMFDFNFPAGVFGAQAITFNSQADGRADVVGTAAARLPTSLMHIFGFQNFNLTANCAAKLEISNTDVMMVLDVTGSMGSGRNSKIEGLKSASHLFLSTLMAADNGDGIIRMGVVPYSGTVNVGALLRPEWMANEVELPSRQHETYGFLGLSSRYRLLDRTFNTTNLRVGGTVSGNTGTRGANVNARWDGCIIERDTVAFNQTIKAPANAYDMDIDLVPTSNEATRWKPFLPAHAYRRNSSSESTTTSNDSSFEALAASGDAGACPVAAMGLTKMDRAGQTAYTNKINGLQSHGFTYHDVGMAWGARLISPTGLFRAQNEIAENGRPIARHIIFMTDGDMTTPRNNLSHQSYELTTGRVGATSDANGVARHNNRFVQLCEAAKQKNIVIWVIGFGGSVTDHTQLTACASPGLLFQAGNNQELSDAFRSIASQISRLRISR